MKKIIFVTIITLLFLGCERDDICDPNTATTSQIVIDFFDATDPVKPRSDINLKVYQDEVKDTLVFNPTALGSLKYIVNSSKIKLPLRVTANKVKYKLIFNNIPGQAKVIDDIEFNYTRENIFVSRACGFKTSFDLKGPDVFDPIILNGTKDKFTGNWIKNISITKSKINNENETHVKIFF